MKSQNNSSHSSTFQLCQGCKVRQNTACGRGSRTVRKMTLIPYHTDAVVRICLIRIDYLKAGILAARRVTGKTRSHSLKLVMRPERLPSLGDSGVPPPVASWRRLSEMYPKQTKKGPPGGPGPQGSVCGLPGGCYKNLPHNSTQSHLILEVLEHCSFECPLHPHRGSTPSLLFRGFHPKTPP